MNDSVHPAIPAVQGTLADTRPRVRRHTLAVRVMHWINVVALALLLMSGLGIFNAHPALYWGDSSYTGRAPWLEIGARDDANGTPTGYARVFGHEFVTTGVLGLSTDDARMYAQGFPSWLTVPSHLWLALSRSWHFFFAWVLVLNGLCFIVYTIASRHLSRDLLPTRSDLAGVGRSIIDHLRFRHATGDAATRYNVLQKIAYLVVVFVLLPLIVLMGLGMSPRLDTLFGGWVDWFGGRQSVRSIHFIVAWLIVAFVLIHVFELLVNGPWNHLRAMITGWYRVPQETGRSNVQDPVARESVPTGGGSFIER